MFIITSSIKAVVFLICKWWDYYTIINFSHFLSLISFFITLLWISTWYQSPSCGSHLNRTSDRYWIRIYLDRMSSPKRIILTFPVSSKFLRILTSKRFWNPSKANLWVSHIVPLCKVERLLLLSPIDFSMEPSLGFQVDEISPPPYPGLSRPVSYCF